MKVFFAILLILAVCSMAIWTVNGGFLLVCPNDLFCARRCFGKPPCINGFCLYCH
uniref:Potassium channel toxin meuK5 n=1 Tax=Mesobuthus eupeus TaxID=34648 RepID=A0A143MHF1_MESEU|nr:potassium channel toxin meuK5 [Mesobuthus eupeus]